MLGDFVWETGMHCLEVWEVFLLPWEVLLQLYRYLTQKILPWGTTRVHYFGQTWDHGLFYSVYKGNRQALAICGYRLRGAYGLYLPCHGSRGFVGCVHRLYGWVVDVQFCADLRWKYTTEKHILVPRIEIWITSNNFNDMNYL